MSTLLSVNVGKTTEVAWQGRTVRTSIWKSPVSGRVMARRLNIDGDAQTDLQGHGGEQRAVMVYQMSSYRFWNEFLGRDQYEYGQFGENLTVEGLEDAEVCIGDRYRIGTAEFEVSQPRVTCYRLGIRMAHPELPALVVTHGRPGFYMRVIREGEIGAGDEIVLLAKGPGQMSVTEVDRLLYTDAHPEASLRKVLRIAALSPGWRQSFESLLAAQGKSAGGNAGLDPSEPALAWAGFRAMRVARTVPESEDVTSIWLEAADGAALPPWRAGQHIAVRAGAGKGGADEIRMYSLSGDPALHAPFANAYRISVKREDRGVVSRYLHAHAAAGMTLDVSAPRGAFGLAAGEAPVVLVSAGIGVTPMLAMLYALAEDAGPARQVWWFHGARDGRHHAFREELRALAARCPGMRTHVAYSRPGDEDRAGEAFDLEGRLSVARMQADGVPREANFYLCGPLPFLRDMRAQLRAWGVPDEHIHEEIFGAEIGRNARVDNPASAPSIAPHLPDGPPGDGPTIAFVRSGLRVNWSDRYTALLDLAEACAVPVRWSCRTGVCHNCRANLLDGKIRYAPQPLSPPPDGTVLLCCAKPEGDVQLEL
ncbi:MOSC and FAD-binding oxidoreductase domain-containing protein [Cupriavidus plantarum]|uniref:MOSC and FAD-binding oxidoreductase domain-containing protein n=1 Tax=Cupriavidus plantarum TaxID=942865 RepID=UPI001B04C39F|nr:MOSC and FAD-binding oxidoreductase domain-containing protein [Cupriavidus plantarum]CAG2147052.1 Flavohemoprotein [Cupriavidus plantarum]SMR85651.1 Ferredoxin-NADP reductase [Cupriavidus plantarum]